MFITREVDDLRGSGKCDQEKNLRRIPVIVEYFTYYEVISTGVVVLGGE